MAKPTRRERRLLAEKGKLTPRRQPLRTAPTSLSAPVERYAAPAKKAAPVEDESSLAQEYTYVKADLLRILVLAVILVGTMVGLRVVLPQ